MAKNKEKFKSDDDFDLDEDLDFDNLDLDAAMSNDENSRISIMGLSKSLMSDVAGRVSDPRRASELAAHFLPDELSSNVSDTIDAFDDASELIDKSIEQAKPIVSDLATTVNKLLPESWKGTREFFSKFIQEKTINQKKDPRKAEDERIAATLNEIFNQQMVQQESIRQEEKAEAAIKEKISQDQHKAEYKALSNINANIQKLTDYNSKVNALYQRKSLEIQLRSFNMQANIYDLLKQYTAKSTGLFDAIMKNTGLPDFVKVTKSEMFKKAFLDKTIDKTIGVIGQRGFGRFAKSVVGSLKSQLASGVSNLGQLGMLSMVGDMIDPSMGMTKEQMAMDAGAGFIVGQLMSMFGEKFKSSEMGQSFTSKATKFAGQMESVPAMLKGWVGNLNEYAKNIQEKSGVKKIKDDPNKWESPEDIRKAEEDAERFKKLSAFEKTINIIKYGGAKGLAKLLSKGMKDSGIYGDDTLDLGKDNAETLNQVAQFTRGAEKSITKIIPGYLARILQQVTQFNTGKAAPLLIFDHGSGKFVEDSSLKTEFFKKINKSANSARTYYKKDINRIKSGLFGKKKGDEDWKEGDEETRTFTDEQEVAMDRLLDMFALNGSYTLHNAASFKEDFKKDIMKNFGKLTKEEAEKLVANRTITQAEADKRLKDGVFSEEEADAIIAQMVALQGDDKATIDKLNDIGGKINTFRRGISFDKTAVKRMIEENPESLKWLEDSGLIKFENNKWKIDEEKFYQQRAIGDITANGQIIPHVEKKASTNSTIQAPGTTELAPPNTGGDTAGRVTGQSSTMQVPKTLLGVNTSMLETLNKIRDLMISGVKVKGFGSGISSSVGNAFDKIGNGISSGIDTLKNFAGTGKEKFFTMIEFIKAKKNEYFALDPNGKIIKYLAKKLKVTPEDLLDLSDHYLEYLKINAKIKFDDAKGIFNEFKSKFVSGAKDKVSNAFNGLMNKTKALGLLPDDYNTEEAGMFGSLKAAAGNAFDMAKNKAGEYYDTAKDKANEYYEKAKNYTKEKCIAEVKNYYSTVKQKFDEGKNKLKELFTKAKEGVTKEKATQTVEQVEAWYKAQLKLLEDRYKATREVMEAKMKEISSNNDENTLFKIASTCYDVASGFLGKAFTFGGDSAKWVFNLIKDAGGSIASGIGKAADMITGTNGAVGEDGKIDESKLTEEQKDALALQRLREAEGNEYSNMFIETPQRLLKLALSGGRGLGSLSLGAGKLATWLAPKAASLGMGAGKFMLGGGLGLGGGLSVLGNAAEFATKGVGKIGSKLFSFGMRMTDDYKVLEKCQDVYLKSNPQTPVLLGRDMKAGYYVDMASGKVIEMLGDIRGDVGRLPVPASQYNGDGSDVEVALTMDDIRTGVVDKKGKDLSRFLLENKARGKSNIRKSWFGSIIGRSVGSDVGEQGKGGKTNEAPITDIEELAKKMAFNYIWFKGKNGNERKKTAEAAIKDINSFLEKNGTLYPSDLKKILKKHLKSNTDVILDAGGSIINGGFKIVNKHLDEHSLFGKASSLIGTFLGANQGGFSTEMDDTMSVDDALEHFPKNTKPFKGKDEKERTENAKKAATAIQKAAKGGKLTPRIYKKIMEKYTVPFSDKAFDMIGGAGKKIADTLEHDILDGKLFGVRSFLGNLKRGLGLRGAFNLAREERKGNKQEEGEPTSTEGFLVGGDGKTEKKSGTTGIKAPTHMFGGLLGKAGGLLGKFGKFIPGVGAPIAAAATVAGGAMANKPQTTQEKNEERAKKKEEEKEKEKEEAQEAAAQKEADEGMSGLLGNVWDKVKKFGIMGIIGIVGAAAFKFKDQIIEVGKGLWKGVKWIWKNVLTPIWKGVKWAYTNVLKPMAKAIWNVGKGLFWVGKKIVSVFSWVGKTIGKIIGGIWGVIRDNPIANFIYGNRNDPEDKGLVGNAVEGVKKAFRSKTAHKMKRGVGKAMSFAMDYSIIGAANKLNNWMTNDRIKLRMLQYGFSGSSDGNYSPTLKLEEYLIEEKCLVEGHGGVLTPDLGKIPTEELNSIFDLETEDDDYEERSSNINDWLAKRFVPVFTATINHVRRIFGEVDLEHIVDAKGESLYLFLKAIKHVDGLDWTYVTDPFTSGNKQMEPTKELFEKLWNKLIADLPEQLRKRVDQGDGKNEPVADMKPKGKVAVNKDGTVVVETEASGKDKVSGTSGKIIKNYKKPTALECIRFKCYGIRDIEPKYVTTMRLVEEAIEDKVIENNGQVSLTIGLEELLSLIGPLFELSSNEAKTDKGKVFEKWFKERFLVVYLKYIGKVFSKYKEKKRENIEQRLQDLTFILELARELVKLPVWDIKFSPWLDKYEMNDDPSTTIRNLNYLEQRIRSGIKSQDVGIDKATTKAREQKAGTSNYSATDNQTSQQGGTVNQQSATGSPTQQGGGVTSVGGTTTTGGGGVTQSVASPTGKAGAVNLTHLGSVSAKYESGKRGAGTISSGKGDHGGKSYGIYQLASKTGTLQKFIKMSGFANDFAGLSPGSQAFDDKWKQLANNPNFADAQHNFIKITHYVPAIDALRKAGFDVSKKGRAVHEAIYSTAVQYGPARVAKFFREAMAGKDFNSMSDADIVSALQDYKYNNVDVHFASSSQAVRDSIRKNRIPNEKADLLKIAGGGGSTSMPSTKTSSEPTAQEQADATKASTEEPTISNPQASAATPAGADASSGGGASDQIGKTGVAMTKENVNAIFDGKKDKKEEKVETTGDAQTSQGGAGGSSGGSTPSPQGGKAAEAINNYISIMQKNAKGSVYSQANRMGNKSYDCSSFVSRNLKEAGFNVNPSNNCGTIKDDLVKAGFTWHGGAFGKDTSKLLPGDILLKSQPQGHRHVETYLGNNQIIGARTASKPYPLGVGPRTYWDDHYEGFLRLEGANASNLGSTAGSSSNAQDANSDAPVSDTRTASPSAQPTPTVTPSAPSNGGSVSETPVASSNSGPSAVGQSVSASNYERDKTPKVEEVKPPKDETGEKMLKVQEEILEILKEISKGNISDSIKDNVDKVIEAIKENGSSSKEEKEDPSKKAAEEAAKKDRMEDKEGYNSSPYTPKSIMNLGKTHFF